MIPYLSKVLYVITGSRKRLIPLVLIFAMTSLLEAAGIWLVGPFINFASDPKSIHDNSLLLSIYKNLGFQNDKQFILAMGISVIVVFLIKSVLYLFCKVYIYKFSFDQKRLLSTRLLNAYLTLPYTFHLKKILLI